MHHTLTRYADGSIGGIIGAITVPVTGIGLAVDAGHIALQAAIGALVGISIKWLYRRALKALDKLEKGELNK